jgi:hypothetical protein
VCVIDWRRGEQEEEEGRGWSEAREGQREAQRGVTGGACYWIDGSL